MERIAAAILRLNDKILICNGEAQAELRLSLGISRREN